jgi:hypothetical protein
MIIVDAAQKKLDAAAAKYRREYNRGYAMSERGDSERAQAILDKANREYDAAKAEFAKARGITRYGSVNLP